jgi:hypothetical protein
MESLICESIRETQNGRVITCNRNATRRMTYVNQESTIEFTENRCNQHLVNNNADTVRSEQI